MSVEASTLKSDHKEDRKKVLRRAFLMASGTLTSRVLGLFRDMALAALFDRAITDAWTAAFRLPNLFRRLFGEGSLSVSFIPVFMQAQKEDSSGTRARNLANALYTLFLIFIGAIAVIGILQMENILDLLLAADYKTDPEKWILTVRMARIMFAFVFFVCGYAYFMGILNALGVFGLPALAPALLNVSMLLFTFMPPQWFAKNGDGLAWGVLVGGVLQMGLLWLVLQARGYLPKFTRALWNDDVKKVLVNMVPGLIGLGLLQFTTLVNLHFASSLGLGSISYIYWADRLLELPLSLVSVSLGAALLPTLSELFLSGEKTRFKETLQEHFLFSLLLAVPAALGLFFLAEPIVDVLFRRGHFTSADTFNTAVVLKVYALSLLFVSTVKIMAPAFYAVKNTWMPAVAAFVGFVLHIAWAPWWIARWNLMGLVLSSLGANIVQCLILLIALRAMITRVDGSYLFKEISKILFAAVALIAAVQVYDPIIRVFGESQMIKGISLAVSILFAMVTYTAAAIVSRSEAAAFVWSHLKSKKPSK